MISNTRNFYKVVAPHPIINDRFLKSTNHDNHVNDNVYVFVTVNTISLRVQPIYPIVVLKY